MEILQRMPFLAQDAVFKRLSEIAEVASLTKEERQRYDESLRHYRDTIAVMHGQYLEGQEKGRADVAKTMKESGVSLTDIVKFTGLDEEQVSQL